MAILSRPKFAPQQRLDLEDVNALLSSFRTDSLLWTKQFLSSTNMIFKGFAVSGTGLNQANVSMTDATLILPQSTVDFSYFISESGAPDITIPDADLTDNARNYVEIQLLTEDNTPLTKAFWDPEANSGAGAEFNQIVNTMTDLTINIVVSTGGFSGSADRIPLAIIDTDGTGQIKIILDRREMFGRLSKPNDLDNNYSWGTKQEPIYQMALTGVTGTFEDGEVISIGGETATVVTGGTVSITFNEPTGINFASGSAVAGVSSGATGTVDAITESFVGVDKNLGSIEQILKALMTEFKLLKGTRFWYENTNSSINSLVSFMDSVIIQNVVDAQYSWDGTELSITDGNITPADADVLAKLRQFGSAKNLDWTRQDGTGGSTTIPIGEQQVLFIKVSEDGSDRVFSGVGSGDTNYQVVDIFDFESSSENYWIAYRENGLLYVRGYGEMEAGESAPISDPDKETILSLIAASSAKTNQDRNIKMIEGGVWSLALNSEDLTLSEDAYIQIPGLTQARNTISAQTINLPNANSVAYISVVRDAGVPVIATVNVADEDAVVLDDNTVIIARRTSDGVVVGTSSFLLKPGEFLELDGALAEINRLLSQLKLTAHETDADKARINTSDIVQLDGTTLSRVIGDFLLSFSGAVIDFTTGEVFEEDGTTPLGVDFTPQTIPVGEYFWYGISLLPGSVGADNRQLAQVQVDLADASDAIQGDAPNAIMSGDIKLGNVQVQNNGGNIELQQVFRLGPGSGSGSGGAGADAEGEYKRRLDLSPFNFVSTTIFELDKDDFVDGSSTGSYSPGDRAFSFNAIGATLVSTQLLDNDYLDDSKRPNWVELIVKWKEGAIDTAATYEASRNGGNEWQAVTMERVGETDTFRGILKFTDEGTLQSLFADATTDGDTEFNTTTQQGQSQSFVVTDAIDLREIDIDLLVTGSPLGNLKAKIVADDGGSPSTDPLDVLSYTNLVNIAGLSTGVYTLDFGNKVLPAGTYHLVLETDQEYKDNFSTGVDSISLRVNSAGSGASIFNGTTWSAADGIKYDIKGITLDLRVRITSSVADVLINDYGVFYDRTPGVTADGELGVDVFEFLGDANRTNFTLVNINNPHPDLLVCYDVFRGQTYVANEGVFRIEGQDIIFDPDFFDDPGELIRLKFVQVRGAAFDTSDQNANQIASLSNEINDISVSEKNYAQNAEFRFWQRQTPATLTARQDDEYSADRWYVLTSGGAVDVQGARVQDSPATSPTRYCGQFRQADATARQFGIAQILEADRIWELRGKTVTFGFWVRSDVGEVTQINANLVEWSGTADTVTSDIVDTWGATPTLVADASYATVSKIDETIDENWKYVQMSVTLGQTMNNLILFVWTPNAEAQNNDIYITQPQVVRGLRARSWESISLEKEKDLEECLRFLYRINNDVGGNVSTSFMGIQSSTTQTQYHIITPSSMRTNPLLSVSNLSHLSSANGAGGAAWSAIAGQPFSPQTIDSRHFSFSVTTGVLTQGNPYRAEFVVGSPVGAFLQLEAEL